MFHANLDRFQKWLQLYLLLNLGLVGFKQVLYNPSCQLNVDSL